MTGISSERRASSAACSDRARRIGAGWAASRSIPGIQPTVEIAVWRCEMPSSGSRSHAASTLSRFIIGSPIPMNTAWSTGSGAAPGWRGRRKCSAWSRISEAERLRPKRIAPVAQNRHVSGHPDCEERHSERRLSR